VWRINKPRHDALALLAIFIPPILILAGALTITLKSFSLFDAASLVLLHSAFSCAYILIYPASQADSPSFKILLLVKERMPEGVRESEIMSFLNPNQLFEARVSDLVEASLIASKNNKFVLTKRGRCLVIPFMLLRRSLGYAAGKG